MNRGSFAIAVLIGFLYGSIGRGQQPYQMGWSQQIGSRNDTDTAGGVAVDASGNVFVAGSTTGSLGATNLGGSDAYLQKYTPSGSLSWSNQIGTSANDSASSVAVDSQGNVVIGGATSGSLAAPNAGGLDMFVARYNAGGSLTSTYQIGTAGQTFSNGYIEQADEVNSVALDRSGNAYIGGYTYGNLAAINQNSFDAVVGKLGSDLSPVWFQQTVSPRGIEGTMSNAVVAATDGSVYSGGYIYLNTGPVATLTAYNSIGELGFATELTFPAQLTPGATIIQSTVNAIALDNAGDIYISGFLNDNAYIAKLDPSGNFLWADTISNSTDALGLAVDSNGNVFITGDQVLPGYSTLGFLAEYSSTGSQLWFEQFGADYLAASTIPDGVAVDGSGRVYIAGSTNAGFNWPNLAGNNAFVAEFNPVPEPEAAMLLLLGAASALVYLAVRNAFRRAHRAA